ncbi:hypothetical protein CPB85DRAFT_1510888 [Mucidula mucida]|nr:hypothetical protein CPB85DRAFT_1510888 [Mucidula mucida]
MLPVSVQWMRASFNKVVFLRKSADVVNRDEECPGTIWAVCIGENKYSTDFVNLLQPFAREGNVTLLAVTPSSANRQYRKWQSPAPSCSVYALKVVPDSLTKITQEVSLSSLRCADILEREAWVGTHGESQTKVWAVSGVIYCLLKWQSYARIVDVPRIRLNNMYRAGELWMYTRIYIPKFVTSYALTLETRLFVFSGAYFNTASEIDMSSSYLIAGQPILVTELNLPLRASVDTPPSYSMSTSTTTTERDEVGPFEAITPITHIDKISALYRFAEKQKTLENQIYALWETIVGLITIMFEQANKNGTLFLYPQPLLGGNGSFIRVMPNSGLYVTWIEDNNVDGVSPILFCEVKRLDIAYDWHTSDGFREAQLLVPLHFGQITLQAFCGFCELPKAKSIHIILLIGIYITVLEFQRPPSQTTLDNISKIIICPSQVTLSPAHQKATNQKTIVELMPDPPKCLIFSECIFSNPNKEGLGLTFSNAFNFAIRSCFSPKRSGPWPYHLALGSCDLLNFLNEDSEPEMLMTAGFQTAITAWYNAFETVDREMPQTPKRGQHGSLLETPTTAGKDYQVTADDSYEPTPPKTKRDLRECKQQRTHPDIRSEQTTPKSAMPFRRKSIVSERHFCGTILSHFIKVTEIVELEPQQ